MTISRITIGEMAVVTLYFSFILMVHFTRQSAAAINPQNIVGAWLFDDGDGEIATDDSVNGNDGELDGAAGAGPRWVEGQFGTALTFNGQEWVHASDESLPGGIEPRTVSAWMKTGKSFNGIIVNYGSHLQKFGPGREVQMGMFNQEVPGYFNDIDKNTALVGSGGAHTGGKTRVNDSKWHHIAGTFDGLTWTLYVDGEVDGVGEPPTATKPNEGLNIGFPIGPHDWGFQGVIDEVVIFDVALTEADVKRLTNGLEAAKAVSPLGKLAMSWGSLKKRY